MTTPLALSFIKTGLVTAVGLSVPAACAALRAGVANATETAFVDSAGEWIMGHQVPLEPNCRGIARLVEMAVLAIGECLEDLPREQWPTTPLLLCIAEPERPGRSPQLEEQLFARLCERLGTGFAPQSAVIAYGRVSAAVALRNARTLICEQEFRNVLVVAVDSLLNAQTLHAYEGEDRLLTPTNANGFIPGEGAAAILLGPLDDESRLVCTGLGLATETAVINSKLPLRADGMVRAIKEALTEASCEMHQLDFRVTDISGEQYYFKEAALALSRILRVRKQEFDIWHPAEGLGESGAVSGLAALIVAETAVRKGYAKGRNILWHASTDAGQRGAAILCSRDLS